MLKQNFNQVNQISFLQLIQVNVHHFNTSRPRSSSVSRYFVTERMQISKGRVLLENR